VAQALSFRKTSNIGLIIPHEAGNSLNSFYWSSIVTEIAQESALCDYNLILYTVKKEGELKDLYKGILQRNKVDGLVIGSELADIDRMNQLAAAEIPFILIGQNPAYNHHFVDIDNAYASRAMTEFLIRRGRKTIGFLSGPLEYHYNKERLNAYLDAVKKAGLNPVHAIADPFLPTSVTKALDELTESKGILDSLFIGGGCEFLYPVLDWRNENIKFRGELELSVFDDFKYLDYIEPAISAVRQPLKEMAREAIRALMMIIRCGEIPPFQKTFMTTITERWHAPRPDKELNDNE